MSGFGIRALKKKNTETDASDKRQFIKHLVYGENYEAVLTFLKLNETHPGEVKLLTKNPFYKDEIWQQLNCTLNAIRSEEVANDLTGLNPRLEVFKSEDEVRFYKDTKFQKFGGRAKPHEIRSEEKFFTKPFYQFKAEALFNSTELENIDETLKSNELNKIISKIEVKKPSDLVEKVNFSLHSGENEIIDCESLYFCESPKTFFKLVSNKKELDDVIGEYTATLENHGAITVHFECDREIYDFKGTMFIPQSMTHEWGSFVIDFGAFDPAESKQSFTVLSFLNDGDLQEEDLVKKIKLLKRVVERVFPEFSKAKYEQSIRYTQEYAIEGINDEYFDKLKDLPVKFIGSGAPIKAEEPSKYQYLPRTLKSIEQYIR